MVLDTTKAATLSELLGEAQRRLAAHTDTPRQDAEVLLAKVIGRRRWWVLAHSKDLLGQPQRGRWEAAVTRLEAGEPLAYVIGEWEFYKLRLRVSPAVLIPRPETELLVDAAISWLKANPARRHAADIGTGSGCIAAALAYNVPDLQIEAGDISNDALEVARKNIERYRLQERVYVKQSDLLSGLHGPFDLITANLPYIPSERVVTLPIARHEPIVALDGGEDGFAYIRPLLQQAAARALSPGGLLLMEIDDSQEHSAPDLARQIFPKADVQLMHDLAGKPRLVVIQT